ncbi:MAG: hypothetical protein L3J65_12330 [Robiginitomaculum sp.]|nr:hypothetical protein [Robiginitomaculum sp.]
MPIEILMSALQPTTPTPRSPLRMQGSIAGLSVCAAPASMDTCIRRYERTREEISHAN